LRHSNLAASIQCSVNAAHRWETLCQQAVSRLYRRGPLHRIDQHIDADVDAGAHTVGGTELRHSDEHEDAQLLRFEVIENAADHSDLGR
jgi:hypothetical protein